MAPDFGFWTAEGRLALVDWKTGASDPDSTAFQLGCYALYANEVLGVPPARVDLYEANLREPLVTPLAWSDERLGAIKERLRLSIRSMRAYLTDPTPTWPRSRTSSGPRICGSAAGATSARCAARSCRALDRPGSRRGEPGVAPSN